MKNIFASGSVESKNLHMLPRGQTKFDESNPTSISKQQISLQNFNFHGFPSFLQRNTEKIFEETGSCEDEEIGRVEERRKSESEQLREKIKKIQIDKPKTNPVAKSNFRIL